MVDFPKLKTSRTDAGLITAIAQRATVNFWHVPVTKLEIAMDIEAAHSKCPLDLLRLLNADEQNFQHDVWGIYRHLDRETGELKDHFVPRFAKRLRKTQ